MSVALVDRAARRGNVGSALAVAVGVALSPLSPIGPVRAVYPDGGFAFDRTGPTASASPPLRLINAITSASS